MKDHDTFLRAAALMRGQRPETRFVCVGGGPAEALSRLKALAGELGLSETLIWAEARGDMPAVMNALDLLVLSSAFGEGFPNVVGEAMACARPVVVTRVGDAAWVAGRPELTVAPGDPEALARAALAVLDQTPEVRQALGRELRARVVESFSLKAMIATSEDALSGLLAPSPRN
jgi:glycosyltransferase involved in cell wall biosynthesis